MQITQLGPYRIDKPLGKGGMGSVYAATDAQTGQRVAIKALTPHLATAEGFRERFEAEIESLKTLRHDGIVRLYGYGEQDGVLFYSMELVDGVSLEDELKAGRRFNWREVTNIAIQLALSLKHAHDHGIVHRDIKPANILLYGEDKVKLADFGIARLFGATSLTTAGGVLGTADYMSPEQADGRPVTAKCDQYSLGGVMYALLTGRPPFRAKNLPQMLQLQRFAQPEPVRRYAPDTPEQLESVIMQLLAKNPADRFPNTQVLARHLQALVMALSRPAADDFALAGEQPGGQDDGGGEAGSSASDLTQAEADVAAGREPRGPLVGSSAAAKVTSSQEAATLAADDAAAIQGANGVGDATSLVGREMRPLVIERPARFTTVEEEEEALRTAQRRSWLALIAPWAILVVLIYLLATVYRHFSRPPSADQLYQAITTRAEADDASRGDIASAIEQFTDRFPNDPRVGKLRRIREEIELDKLERRLQRQARGSGAGDTPMLEVEKLYLRTQVVKDTSPETAASMLESLIALYGPAGIGKPDPQVTAVVQLATRRLKTLRDELAAQHSQQINSLKERLDAAARLTATDPKQAAAMYRAIVELHQENEWAKAVVQEARVRLAKIDN
jgi:serine/threonine-protein kinase